MCFRPPGIEQSVTCPGCGKKINAVMGNIPPVCPFCEEDIAAAAAEAKARGMPASASGSLPTPKAPGIPTPPKPDGVPQSR